MHIIPDSNAEKSLHDKSGSRRNAAVVQHRGTSDIRSSSQERCGRKAVDRSGQIIKIRRYVFPIRPCADGVTFKEHCSRLGTTSLL